MQKRMVSGRVRVCAQLIARNDWWLEAERAEFRPKPRTASRHKHTKREGGRERERAREQEKSLNIKQLRPKWHVA